MPRFRPAVLAACLAVALTAFLPAPGAASRNAEQPSATAVSESPSGTLLGSTLAWGRSAFAWLQALIAAEHGTVVQVAPPPPPPPPEPEFEPAS